MNNCQKLYQLMQANNLKLSLADLLEFTYNQWNDDYLSINLAVEHLEASLDPDIMLLPDFTATIRLGRYISMGRNTGK